MTLIPLDNYIGSSHQPLNGGECFYITLEICSNFNRNSYLAPWGHNIRHNIKSVSPTVQDLLSIQVRSYMLENIFTARNCEATDGMIISKLFLSLTQQVLE
ncbi:hypothetical protein GmHk_12G034838 [Glycine max]|nr:hypothetical protein GmHk_12G034838 [Glycine max]